MLTTAIIAFLETFKHNPELKVRVWLHIYHMEQHTPKGKVLHLTHEMKYVLYLIKKGGF